MRTAAEVVDALLDHGLRLVNDEGHIRVRVCRAIAKPLTNELRAAIREHARELAELIATGEASPSGQLNLLREPPANDNASAPTAPMARVVVEAERTTRSSPTRSLGRDRVCCNCGTRVSPNGVRPQGWDFHLYGDDLLGSCSPECRAEAGFPERKPGPVLNPYDAANAQREAKR